MKVELNNYCEFWETQLYKEKIHDLKKGITVLIGCNGAGKTTFLDLLENKFKDNENWLVKNYNTERTKSFLEEGYGSSTTFINVIKSSEGESNTIVIGEMFQDLGNQIKNSEKENIMILFDGLDSGISVDQFDDYFKVFKLIQNDCKDKNLYFIFSTNSYEFAKNYNCYFLQENKYIESPKTYEEFKKIIIESKKIKKEFLKK